MASNTRLDNLDPDKPLKLSIWDQIAPRTYIQLGFCFPFQGPHFPGIDALTKEQLETETALKLAVHALSLNIDGLTGTLELGPEGTPDENHVFIRGSPARVIPCERLAMPERLRWYPDFCEGGFSASGFVEPCFQLDGKIERGKVTPVAQIRYGFVSGGFFLFLYLNHAVADGSAMNAFAEVLAGETLCVKVDIPMTLTLNLPGVLPLQKGETEESLIARCPEYTTLPNPTGPTQHFLRPDGVDPATISKTGKIFTFKHSKLHALRNTLYPPGPDSPSPPSTYTILAALAWAHIAAAQSSDAFMPPSSDSETAIFSNPVNWSRTPYPGEAFGNGDYFGSSTVWAISRKFSPKDVRSAATDLKMLRRLADEIHLINHERATQPAYIHARTRLFQLMENPRVLGLRFDYRHSANLGMNDWRGVGADAYWSFPFVEGGKAVKADAVRRVQGQWNLGGGLVLPRREGSEVVELLVTLGEEAMGRLREDGAWMEWCAGVVE